MSSIFKTHPLLKIINGSLVDLPSPTSISSWWNFGSLLGVCLMAQLVTGLFLAMQFTADTFVSFSSVSHMNQDILNGAILRMLHANGASIFFFCLYFHAGRGLYYGSYFFHMTWGVGVVIMLVTMAAAFLGYVLPWGQMSFWGTSVITNLLSALPIIGGDVVMWLWGGFAVGNSTLTRFFAFHFLVPFIVVVLALIHLMFLHETGSGNPLGLSLNLNKIPFHPYFTTKDLLGGVWMLFSLFILVLSFPWLLGDPENFIMSNPLVTPVHIQPEWYFLFAYAILRSIPNKLGGVVALAMAILILLVMVIFKTTKFRNSQFYTCSKLYFWTLAVAVILLTWIGARPVEEPYVVVGQFLTIYYFLFYLSLYYIQITWDRILL